MDGFCSCFVDSDTTVENHSYKSGKFLSNYHRKSMILKRVFKYKTHKSRLLNVSKKVRDVLNSS